MRRTCTCLKSERLGLPTIIRRTQSAARTDCQKTIATLCTLPTAENGREMAAAMWTSCIRRAFVEPRKRDQKKSMIRAAVVTLAVIG